MTANNLELATDIYFLCAFLISFLIVLSIFMGREAIRKYRYALIMRSRGLFRDRRRSDAVAAEEGAPDLASPKPAFSWTSFGPSGPSEEISEAELGQHAATFEFAARKYGSRGQKFGIGWMMSCLAYIIIGGIGFYFVTVAARAIIDTSPTLPLFAGVVTAAFLGGYLFTTTTLIQDLWNFDLSPISFLRASRQIIVSVGLAGIVAAIFAKHGLIDFSADANIAPRLFLLIGFAIGFVPGFGERYLFSALRQFGAFTKDFDEGAFKVSRIKPLDCIDGIDHWSAYRLELHMIRDVHNLATANPIVLYAETPFDFQQVVDWVGQAQLASVVDSDTYRKLKCLGVLSSIDLYGALHAGTPRHIEQIGQVLAEEMAAHKVPGVTQLGGMLEPELVTAWVLHRLSSPHFWRLLELNLRLYRGIETPFAQPLSVRSVVPPEAQ